MEVSSYSTHIDWYQFTVKLTDVDFEGAFLNEYTAIEAATRRALGESLHALLFNEVEGIGSGQVYRYKSRAAFASGAQLFHGGHPHVTVVLSGTALMNIENLQPGAVWGILDATRDICTRVDIATTFATPTSVDEYMKDHLMSASRVTSESGTTYYLGSRKSDQFTRVYAYNAPHPRAGTIRIEHEYKSKAAKAVAAHLNADNLIEIAKGRSMKKKMEVSFMDSGAVGITVDAMRTKSAERTVYWLSTSVKQAIKRLVEEKELTVDEVFEILFDQFDEKKGGTF